MPKSIDEYFDKFYQKLLGMTSIEVAGFRRLRTVS
jgi:hypothetical protein